MGLDARKPVFGVSDKPVSSATESSKKIEISLVASLDMMLTNKRITKTLIRLRGCAGAAGQRLCCSQPPEDRFSRVKAQLCFG